MWSLQGKAKLKKSGENDKNIRAFRRNSSEHVAAKAKITDRGLVDVTKFEFVGVQEDIV